MEQSIFSRLNNTSKWFVILISLLGFTVPVSAATLFEDFEGIGGLLPNGNGKAIFSVGAANFSGGVSGVAGIRELYKSGTHAWMVNGGNTGTIQFGPNVTEVSFYAKAYSLADNTSVITAFDGANNLLASLILNSTDPFTKFTVTGLIDRIEFVNNDSDSSRMNALDDFSVTTVPIPAAFWLFGTALLATFRLSRLTKTV